jgi:outer membrane protein assembly factor BamE (lipoprotein component of BamABCDE complex)
MSMLKAVIPIVLILALAACASSTQSKLKRVESGMGFKEVRHIMGRPDATQTVRKDGSVYVLYRYDHRRCNPNLSYYERCDFSVIFKNEKVIDTITKNGQSYSPHTEALYLFQPR